MTEPDAETIYATLLTLVGERVPDRDCNGCTACCQHLVIDDPDLQKPIGELCRHCTGTGCGIYETRPAVCRGFHCMWRTWDGLSEAMRPKESDIMIHFLSNEKSDYFHKLAFVVTAIEKPAYYTAEFQSMLGLLVELCRIPVISVVNEEPYVVYPDPALADAILDPEGTLFTPLRAEAAAWRERYDALHALCFSQGRSGVSDAAPIA